MLDVERRKKLIQEFGGAAPGDDTLVSVLWVVMDPTSRNHVSGKLDAENVTYPELRVALLQFISLSAATNNSNTSKASTAMDVSAIAVATPDGTGSVSPAGFVADQSQAAPPAAQPLWSVNEAGWPIDDEGWEIDGYIDEKLNFVKGAKGKGKGQCFNCGG